MSFGFTEKPWSVVNCDSCGMAYMAGSDHRCGAVLIIDGEAVDIVLQLPATTDDPRNHTEFSERE